MRTDKFIVTYLQALRGDIKMAQSNLQCIELYKENANNEDCLNEKQLSVSNIKVLENELHNRKMKIRHFLSTSSSDTNIVINKIGYNYDIDNKKNEIYEMWWWLDENLLKPIRMTLL